MTHFIRDNTSPGSAKTDYSLSTVPASQKIAAVDYNTYRQAFLDIQSYLRDGVLDAMPTLSVGLSTAPTTINSGSALFPSTVPKAEVQTGTGVGAYNEAIVVRHNGVDVNAVTRRLGILLKLSSEGSSGESAKHVGLLAESVATFGNSPSLHLVTNDTKRLTIDSAGAVSTFATTWLHKNVAAHVVQIGKDVASTTGADVGIDFLGSSDLFISTKVATSSTLKFRIGAGTSSGYTTTWLTVDGSGNATFSGNVRINGQSGFNNTAPIAKPTVTGSRAANAALASLLTALANYGLVTDSSTA